MARAYVDVHPRETETRHTAPYFRVQESRLGVPLVSASTSTDRIEQFFHHLAILKDYARRVIAGGDVLSTNEEDDRKDRIRQFLDIGLSFDLTEKEMVTILFRELFTANR